MITPCRVRGTRTAATRPRLRRAGRAWDDRLARGRRSEALARELLTASGYTIERTNVRFPAGEIDIIAREGATLCFVEVRSTACVEWGGPLGSITDQKRRRLIRAARWYLARERTLPAEIRFDVVAVVWEDGPTLELVRGAFDASGLNL